MKNNKSGIPVTLTRIAVSLLLVFFASCNIEKNRKILNFFFDGVPNSKDTAIKTESSGSGVKVVPKKFKPVKTVVYKSEHPDHKKRNCSKCHSKTSANFLITSKKKLCLTCHKPEKFKGKFIHGPVAVKACLICHLPHQSKYRKLLADEGNRICLSCHKTPGADLSILASAGNCSKCHEPHISDNKYFLKKEFKNMVHEKKSSAPKT